MSDESSERQDEYDIAGPLYHYTDAKGLLGIIESKKLWATHIRYLNDEREFRHALGLADSIIARLARDRVYEYEILQTLSDFTDRIKEVDSFVSSFSLLGDDLNQWRAYSHNGAGFSVSFEPRVMNELFAETGFSLYPCCYDDEQSNDELRDIYTVAADQLRDKPSERDHVLAEFMAGLLLVAAWSKHPAFEAEQEWRLVGNRFYGNSMNTKCRATDSMLIPYVEVDLNLVNMNGSPISGVCVGPSAHKELSVQALKTHLANNGLPSIEPSESKIPFRNW